MGLAIIYLHLFIPTFELPANQGSITNTQRKVVASVSPRNREGLSCSRNPLRNQCTRCFSWITDVVSLCGFILVAGVEALDLLFCALVAVTCPEEVAML